REELRYTGAFERVELPLAVVCLLLVTLLGVWNIFLHKESGMVDAEQKRWRNGTLDYLLGNNRQGVLGYMEYVTDPIKNYATKIDEETEDTTFDQMKHVRNLLQQDVTRMEKELGQDTEITQPQSALRALALVLDVLEDQAGEKGRPSIRMVRST